MSSVDETDKKVLQYYREAFPALKAENEHLRASVKALETLVADLRHQLALFRGTSVPTRTRHQEEDDEH
jgi:hypothetical protein